MSEVVLKGFTKVDEFTDPELLDKTTLSELTNMTLDSTGGKAIKRGGMQRANVNATGGVTYSLHDVVDNLGNDYLLAQVAGTFKKSASGTGSWNTLKSLTGTTNKLFMASYNSKYYFTNGVDAPFETDLSSATNVGIAKPTVTGIVTNGSGYGQLTPNARYTYYMVYCTASGEQSPASQPFTHYCNANDSNSTNASVSTIEFTVLPDASLVDSRITSKKIYRTKANENIPYFLASLKPTDTLFVDGFPDTYLDTSQTIPDIKTPTKAKYILSHKERIIMANVSFSVSVAQPTHAKAGNGYVFSGVEGTAPSSLTAGTYKYRVYWFDEFGNVSNYIETANIVIAGSKAINVRHIPRSLDPTVSAMLYRTNDAGVTWYNMGVIGDGDGITDDFPNSELTAATLPTATTGTQTFKCRVIASEIGISGFRPNEFPALNFIEVDPDDGDEVTGLTDDGDGILVWKKNSIYKIYTSGSPQGGWRVEKIVSQIGCDEPNSLQKVGEKVYFMSNKQVYRFPDALNDSLSTERRTTFSGFSACYDSAYSNSNQWYVLVMGSSNTLMVYDEKLKTWYKFTGTDMTWRAIAEKKYGTSIPRGTLLFAHSGIQIISKYDTTTKLDHNNSTDNQISCTLKTKTLTFNDPTVFARPRILLSDYYKRASQDVLHTVYCVNDNTSYTYTDSTNVNDSIKTVSIGAAGSGYAVGDILTLAGGTGGQVLVEAVDGGGLIEAISLYAAGYGYTTGTKSTSGGTGTSATITIGAVNPTYYKTLKRVITTPEIFSKLYYQISGTGFDEFNGAKLSFNILNRGRRFE